MAGRVASRSPARGLTSPYWQNVLHVLEPISVDAAMKAVDAWMQKTSAAQRQLELALQKAEFDVAHARRQYDSVDPANRLVAGELEHRWNVALEAKQNIENDIVALLADRPTLLGAEEQEALRRLGGTPRRRLQRRSEFCEWPSMKALFAKKMTEFVL